MKTKGIRQIIKERVDYLKKLKIEIQNLNKNMPQEDLHETLIAYSGNIRLRMWHF